jgi:hypothetical protein
VLGQDAISPPGPFAQAGRGFARLAAGSVLRLQVPATPDPLDEAAGEAERQAVLGLLPQPASAQAIGLAPRQSAPGEAPLRRRAGAVAASGRDAGSQAT